ncbi:MAG: hypothetical protein K6B44_04880 [Lachnospiraceae bacterium]|nr:hypothetical protein [Lachnospiraceae bacterium]
MKFLIKRITALTCLGLLFGDILIGEVLVVITGGLIGEIKDPPTGTLDGSPTPILDTVSQGFRVFFLILMGVMLLVVIVKLVLNLFFCGRAFRDGKYGFYLAHSLNGVVSAIINLVLAFVAFTFGSLVIGFSQIDLLTRFFPADVILGLFLLVNLIITNKYAKDENP